MAKRVTMDIEEALPPESFFKRWLEVWPTAEPPKSFILFSAMSMLGACLGREVWLDHDYHTLYPMLNVLLIGPSGIGKSTAMDNISVRTLLDSLGDDEKPTIYGKASPAKLHQDLCAHPKAILMASELAAFFTKEKHQEALIPYVTQLLDYPPFVEIRLKSEKDMKVLCPAVTVIGGSTKEWLQEQLPDSAATGGFLARFLIVSEEHKERRVALPGLAMGRSLKREVMSAREVIVSQFRDLLKVKGPLTFQDYDAADTYSLWYSVHQPETGFLSPFSARAGEFVLRLSLLLAISCERDYILGSDVKAAIRLYEYATSQLQQIVVPYSPQGKLLMKVLDVIGNESVNAQGIRRAMRNTATSRSVDELIMSLIASGEILNTPEGYRRV